MAPCSIEKSQRKFGFLLAYLYLCPRKAKYIMTTVELNAQIWRDMAEIADNESLMKQLAKYLKKLVAKKHDSTLMTKEEFFAKLDRSEKQIQEGKGTTFTDREEMNAWLNSL
jgi:uncharacterized short protein YbdD (DUF466 family)